MTGLGLSLLLLFGAPPASLTGYEFVPAPARLDSASQLADLVRVALDAEEDPVFRGRALTLLARSGSPSAEPALRAALAVTEPPFLRRKAIVALAALRGASALPDVEATYRLARSDVRMREACAEALRSLGPAAALSRARLKRLERDPTLRILLGERPRTPVRSRPDRKPQ